MDKDKQEFYVDNQGWTRSVSYDDKYGMARKFARVIETPHGQILLRIVEIDDEDIHDDRRWGVSLTAFFPFEAFNEATVTIKGMFYECAEQIIERADGHPEDIKMVDHFLNVVRKFCEAEEE